MPPQATAFLKIKQPMKLRDILDTSLCTFYASITFMDGVELGVKIISGLSAVFVGYLAWLSYRSSKRLERAQRELAEENLKQLRKNESN